MANENTFGEQSFFQSKKAIESNYPQGSDVEMRESKENLSSLGKISFREAIQQIKQISQELKKVSDKIDGCLKELASLRPNITVFLEGDKIIRRPANYNNDLYEYEKFSEYKGIHEARRDKLREELAQLTEFVEKQQNEASCFEKVTAKCTII